MILKQFFKTIILLKNSGTSYKSGNLNSGKSFLVQNRNLIFFSKIEKLKNAF